MPQPASAIVEPRLACRSDRKEDPIECSLHTLPKPLMREFQHVFGDKYLRNDDGDDEMRGIGDVSSASASTSTLSAELLAIPTNQHARHDLVAIGDHIEAEKDRLLNCFLEFGEEVCSKIQQAGYWADYIDPCSGLPMLTKNCNKVYSEVDGMECLLNYRAYNAGFCKVLTHPRWGSAVYPATIFCYAPRDVVAQILNAHYIQ
ncbi:unnamed protein product [Pseudo-nitzschia multistriata]|uniref:Methylmalonic aciduria and homocystinuria type D protein n=1 Tax=Pseudo-nitzschia multistriata TaxID=183589 RepID=A0A448Z9C1_9STRA|nr:unnamed protein product [Pseudo-nitzschia multistriata]